MKVVIEEYNPEWPISFEKIKNEITEALSHLNPVIEHIGSTSVTNLKAKPVIDILVGIHNPTDLDLAITPLVNKEFIYYEKYNSSMPYRRFFVKLKNKPEKFLIPSVYNEFDEVPNELNDYKLAHIHLLEYQSIHWVRHVAFRDYISKHNNIKELYEQLKLSLSKRDWKDGNDYNAAKDDFIKDIEAKAVEWYKNFN